MELVYLRPRPGDAVQPAELVVQLNGGAVHLMPLSPAQLSNLALDALHLFVGHFRAEQAVTECVGG